MLRCITNESFPFSKSESICSTERFDNFQEVSVYGAGLVCRSVTPMKGGGEGDVGLDGTRFNLIALFHPAMAADLKMRARRVPILVQYIVVTNRCRLKYYESSIRFEYSIPSVCLWKIHA